MNRKLANLFWGVGLILIGGLALVQTMGFLDNLTPYMWVTVFAGIGLASLLAYFTSGGRDWGWLFPAGVFAGVALVIALATNGIDGAIVAAPIFIGIGLPFVVVFLKDRSRWWALIPTGVMAFLTFTMLVVDRVRGEWVGAGLFVFIGAAFLLVYLSRRTNTWAALVAYIMFVMAFMPLMALTSRPELAGTLFMMAAGLPFLFVYLSSPLRWWAVIPAGVLITTGLVTAVTLLPGLPGPGFDNRIPNALMPAGMAVTFAVVWLRHHKNWAMYVTLVGVGLSAAALLTSRTFDMYWPLLVIAVGMFLLFRAIFVRSAQPAS